MNTITFHNVCELRQKTRLVRKMSDPLLIIASSVGFVNIAYFIFYTKLGPSNRDTFSGTCTCTCTRICKQPDF